MKKTLLTSIILCACFLGGAQITISSQLPGNGMLLKEQLWNLVVTNNNDAVTEIKIQLDIKEITMGQSVLNATSGYMLIGKGVKLVTLKDLHPILYNYVDADFSGNYLPCGSYSISYHVVALIPLKGDVPVADEVTRITITPLSPPLLTYPANESIIENLYPQLSWAPPVPIQMFNPLLYDIKVAVIDEGQKAREAIEFNQPVYSNMNLTISTDKLPSSFTALENGKQYAWQVTARSGMNCAVASDVWIFSIGKDSVKTIIDAAPFVRISSSGTEVTIVHQGVIKMEFINTSSDNTAEFKLYKIADKDKKNRKEIKFSLQLQQGSNFLTYDTYKKHKLDEKAVYELSVTNSRGEQWFMKFTPIYYSK